MSVADQLRAALGMEAPDASLEGLPSIYKHLATGVRGGEAVRVFDTSAPGGGSEFMRWVGPKEFQRIQEAQERRRAEQAERDWCPYTQGAKR